MRQLANLTEQARTALLSGDSTLFNAAINGTFDERRRLYELRADHVQMVEAAERNDFEAARDIHARILPLTQINFVESNPVPVKAAMAAMGLIEEVYRLPMTPPRAESREKILRVLNELRLVKNPALV